MKYGLVRPCAHCPFRTDCLEGWLGEERAEEIANSIASGAVFPCHETTRATDDDEGSMAIAPDSQHCAGALIVMEKMEQPNQMMRIAERLRMYDHTKMDMSAPVFDGWEEFICHHAGDAQ